jgi:hypothetical protein
MNMRGIVRAHSVNLGPALVAGPVVLGICPVDKRRPLLQNCREALLQCQVLGWRTIAQCLFAGYRGVRVHQRRGKLPGRKINPQAINLIIEVPAIRVESVDFSGIRSL